MVLQVSTVQLEAMPQLASKCHQLSHLCRFASACRYFGGIRSCPRVMHHVIPGQVLGHRQSTR